MRCWPSGTPFNSCSREASPALEASDHLAPVRKGASVAGDTGSGAGPGTTWNRPGGADLGGTVARWCPSCGQPLPEESARFCVSCGTDATAEQWPTADFPSPEPDPGWQPTAPWEGGSSPPGQPTLSPPTFAPPPPPPTPPAWHSPPAQPWPSGSSPEQSASFPPWPSGSSPEESESSPPWPSTSSPQESESSPP